MGAISQPILRSKSQELSKPTPAFLQSYPNGKTVLKRVKPVIIDEESIIQEQEEEQIEKQKSALLNLEEYATLEQNSECSDHDLEIKVKWNDFIKMKERNYLDDYQIIREIGRGGFGKVNKVKSKYTGIYRAAKKIKKSNLDKQEQQKLFLEMTIMQSLDHSNIVKLFQVYNYKNHFVLILQLCEGGQLFKKIIVSNGLSETYIASVVKQILKVLLYLRHKGIVHRDLKPENMLFEKNSQTLKIIDFGIASKRQKSEFLTQRVGTPYYVAPEVLLKKYDQRCDIWATGVIMYMMMTRRPPFKGQSQQQVMQNILVKEPLFNKQMYQKYSLQCIDFLQKTLIKNPQNRISLEDAYKHPWLQKQLKNPKLFESQKEVIGQIQNFKFKNKLQAVIYTYIVSQVMTTPQKELFVKIFEELDQNNDGVISKGQFQNALETKSTISAKRMSLLMRMIDTNNSGYIDLTEFIVAGLKIKDFFTEEHFNQAFSYFDIDHSGEISYDQIAFFLEDKSQSEQSIKKIFQQIDQNNDGSISREEFVQLLMKNNRSNFFYRKEKNYHGNNLSTV